MQAFSFPWPITDALTCFAHIADQPYSLFFDSARDGHPLSQYSYICFDPFETITAKNGVVTITENNKKMVTENNPFDALEKRWAQYTANNTIKKIPPFQGGAAGFFGYDLARSIETLPKLAHDTKTLPDMVIGFYDKILSFDHKKGQAWLVIQAESKKQAQAIQDAVKQQNWQKSFYPCSYHSPDLDFQPSHGAQKFKQDIAQVIDYILAGDIFQANITRRFDAKLPEGFDPFHHYCQLRQINPAPFGAYLNFEDLQIASASPERFIKSENRQVETRPIKGTSAQGQTKEDDLLVRNKLLNSQKDRAENAMIVDLLRNDLAKSCEDQSIDVPQLCGLESYEGLHHLVSIIRGTLRVDQSPISLLKNCFPGGSVTGAPKIRAMEIIEELEPQRRGPHFGSIGFIGFNGVMDSNIAIRSLVYHQDHVSLQTGGGITAKSKPDQELNESLIKANKLFESFESMQTAEIIKHQ